MNDPTACPVCDSSVPLTLRGEHAVLDQTYRCFACSTCMVEFWWPLKNPGATWYEHDERYAGRNEDPILEPNWNHTKIISFLKPMRGRVLDVGCGVGNFLAHAQSQGWEPHGIDFDRDAIEAGKRTFDLKDLEVSDVAEYRAMHSGEQFDLITFFDVIEHIDNHGKFFEHVRALLVPRGYIAMSMPYRHHANFLMPGDLPPRHLTRWDRRSLTNFLERQDFEVCYLGRRTEGLRYLIIKLRFRFGAMTSFNLVKKAKRVSGTHDSRSSLLVRVASLAAKTKDAVLFGLPALAIWLAMLGSPKRYVTLYCIARRKHDVEAAD